jgi:uncharacterized membrane protein YciS (DUF1049 family)
MDMSNDRSPTAPIIVGVAQEVLQLMAISPKRRGNDIMFHVLLASSGLDFGATCLILFVVGLLIAKQIHKAMVERSLRQRDPQAYVRLKEIENQEKQRQHDKKMAGIKLGQVIGRWFFGGH